MNSEPLVSVIIPTKDSENTIDLCLQSIKAQSYNNVELIVIDNYSRDRTKDIARGYGAKVYLKGPERCAQVNFGVLKASGKYVYRVDSDFVREPNGGRGAVDRREGVGFDASADRNSSDPTVSFW